MRQWIADLLLPAAEFIRAVVAAVPMVAVRGLVFLILLALAVWVISLAPQVPENNNGKPRILTDLRFFAVAVLALQALMYIIF